jgi:hypothetical protein
VVGFHHKARFTTAAREPNLDLIALAVDLLSEIYLSTNRKAAA